MGNQWRQWETLFWGASKITVHGNCSHEIKRPLLLRRKAMTNLDSVVMYGWESWTIKKTEHWRTDAFELWCWRWLLRVPWRARRSNLNIHQKDWCWSWSSNTLATWCEQLTHWKRPWCWERLKAGGKGMTEDEMVGWHHWLMDMRLSKQRETVKDREAWRAAGHGVTESDTT